MSEPRASLTKVGLTALTPGTLHSALCVHIVRAAEWEQERGHAWVSGTGSAGSPASRGGPCSPALCSLQTDKERLSTEARELRQKVRHLQDQLSPLTRQRDYQEKEIQRLNKVGASGLVPRAGGASWSPAAMPPSQCPDPPHSRASLGQGTGAEGLRAAPRFPHLRPSLPSHWWPAWDACARSPALSLDVLFPHTVPPCSGQRDLPRISLRSPCSVPVEYRQRLLHPFSHFLAITYFTFCLLVQWWEGCIFSEACPPGTGAVPGTEHMLRRYSLMGAMSPGPRVPALAKWGPGRWGAQGGLGKAETVSPWPRRVAVGRARPVPSLGPHVAPVLPSEPWLASSQPCPPCSAGVRGTH